MHTENIKEQKPVISKRKKIKSQSKAAKVKKKSRTTQESEKNSAHRLYL